MVMATGALAGVSAFDQSSSQAVTASGSVQIIEETATSPSHSIQTRESKMNGTFVAEEESQQQNQQGVNAAAYNNGQSNSVVADLLRVYDNLTQSSTPQISSATANRVGGGENGGESTTDIQPPEYPKQPHIPYGVPTRHSYHHGSANRSGLSASTENFDPPPYQQPPSSFVSRRAAPSPPVAIPDSINMERQDDEEAASVADESDEQGSYHRATSKRKRRGSHNTHSSSPRGSNASISNETKSNKSKKSRQDGKWSKRFTWPEDLHRDFVSAIFDVGLKQSSPSAIIEHMPKHEQITTERIKSHLQKYRLHRLKSKREFISSYEASLRNFQNRGGTNGINSIAGGEVAAHLTYTTVDDPANRRADAAVVVGEEPTPLMAASMDDVHPKIHTVGQGDASPMPVNEHESQQPPQNESLILPQLTEAEKQSPIGSALGYLMGLFFSLKQQLLIQREAAGVNVNTGDGPPPVPELFNTALIGSAHTAVSSSAAAQLPGAEINADGSMGQPAMPSARMNIEENTMMKREMQNQMAVQNKMRALKQQELAKYKKGSSPSKSGDVKMSAGGSSSFSHSTSSHPPFPAKDDGNHAATDNSHSQGAGETAGNDMTENNRRPHGLSFGNSDDFWNADVSDEQLFEFLMNS
jgi:SHAQKYF class myb-like DNA-binding protein